jgi:hypothetical protein
VSRISLLVWATCMVKRGNEVTDPALIQDSDNIQTNLTHTIEIESKNSCKKTNELD